MQFFIMTNLKWINFSLNYVLSLQSSHIAPEKPYERISKEFGQLIFSIILRALLELTLISIKERGGMTFRNQVPYLAAKAFPTRFSIFQLIIFIGSNLMIFLAQLSHTNCQLPSANFIWIEIIKSCIKSVPFIIENP